MPGIAQEDILEIEQLDRIEMDEAEIARTRREAELNG